MVLYCSRRRRRPSAEEEQRKQSAEQQQKQAQVATAAAADGIYEEIDLEVDGYSVPNHWKLPRSAPGDCDQLGGADAVGLYQSTPVYTT